MTAESHRFDFDSHWITERCDRGLPFVSAGPFLTGVVTFGLFWDLTSGAYLALNWRAMDLPFLVVSAMALFWVNVAPYLIYTYDEVVLPNFFEKFSELCEDEAELERIARKYNAYFADTHWITSLFWATAVFLIGWYGTPVLRSYGMTGGDELFLYLTYGYGIYIGGVLGGPGTVGPITTMRVIREVADLEFDIVPLHPDQLGGLSNVGYFSIRTTLLYSSASLFLPLGIRLSTDITHGWVIIGVLAVYIVTVLVSFVYPTLKIKREAVEVRDRTLEQLQDRASELQARIREHEQNELSSVKLELELQRVRSEYDDYNSVRLYPLQVDILLQLAGSIVLPLLLLVVELKLEELL